MSGAGTTQTGGWWTVLDVCCAVITSGVMVAFAAAVLGWNS